MNIAVVGEQIWKRFAEVCDRLDWLKNKDYDTNDGRSKNRDALNEEINVITRKETTITWVTKFNKAGVPCGEINDIGQAFESPQVKHLSMAKKINSSERGLTELVGQPIIMSRTPSTISAPPPRSGEHCDDILKSLGYTGEAISRLRNSKTI